MINILALSLVATSLAAAGIWSPNPQRQYVRPKEVHTVVVVEYDEYGQRGTKVSISSPPPSRKQPKPKSLPGGHIPGELICDAFGKCTQTFASVFDLAKDKVSVAADEAKDKVKETACKAKEALAQKVKGTMETAKDTAEALRSHVVNNGTEAMEKTERKARSSATAEALRSHVVNNGTEAMEKTERKARSSANKLLDTAYGMCVWVTFISSTVLAEALPRQQLVAVQSKIHPVYAKAMGFSVGLALSETLFSSKTDMFQAFNLLCYFFFVLVMLVRMRIEKEDRSGRESLVVEESRAREAATKSRESPSSAANIGRPFRRSNSGGWRSFHNCLRNCTGIYSNLIIYLTGPPRETAANAAAQVNAWSETLSLQPLLGAFIAIMFFFSLYLAAFGQGGFKPCVQAFGADQFYKQDPEECKAQGNKENPFVRIGRVFILAVRNRKTTSSAALATDEEARRSLPAESFKQFKFLDKALHAPDVPKEQVQVFSISEVEEAKTVIRLVQIWSASLFSAVAVSQEDDVTLYVVEPRSSEVGSVAGSNQLSSSTLVYGAHNKKKQTLRVLIFDIGQYPNFDDETATAEEDIVDDNEDEVTTVNEHVEHLFCNSYNPEEEKEEEEVPEEKKKKKMSREYNWNMSELLQIPEEELVKIVVDCYTKVIRIKKDDCFDTKEDLKIALYMKCVEDGYQLKVNKSSKDRFETRCMIDKNYRDGRFELLFIAIGAAIRSFITCMRPVIIVDGAYLKGRYLRTWFMRHLRDCIGPISNLTIISDRVNSIDNAVRRCFPDAFHGLCGVHLYRNLKSRRVLPQCAQTLEDVGFERWSRVHQLGARYGFMTSNSAESINALIALHLNQDDSSAYAMDYYTTEVYQQTYTDIGYPIPHPSEWDIPDDLQTVLPLVMDSRLPGRPKNHNRIPSKGEEKRISTCSRCKESGHTRLTYGSPVPSQSSFPLPKYRSSSKSKTHMVPSKRKSKSQSQPTSPFGTY
ncbi:hypothetical protein F3Y22_tig00111131pilonHSYRG00144 [Hibiscus syriacus]|uniref:TMEM205-like domain-containing protein n=1 Tax=Hibiscus syriacus TaxID=106335 RepID=A0A6A2YZS1_HIBSY|nr:hypothetical protein F3Y22_tig00111131pilonHSYRG00144 [Hibiscus syriacus]